MGICDLHANGVNTGMIRIIIKIAPIIIQKNLIIAQSEFEEEEH